MVQDTLDPDRVLLESRASSPVELARLGIEAAQAEDFERGLIYLAEAYRRATTGTEAKLPSLALSYYGLCLAIHRGKIKEGAEFCRLAIEKEFYNADHYANLARVWLAGRSRRRAVEALDRGLALEPGNVVLRHLAHELGQRRKPVLAFLARENPVNVTLGKVRHKLAKRPERAGGSKP